MADEPKPDDIKEILADLDAILSGLNPSAKDSAPPKAPLPPAGGESKPPDSMKIELGPRAGPSKPSGPQTPPPARVIPPVNQPASSAAAPGKPLIPPSPAAASAPPTKPPSAFAPPPISTPSPMASVPSGVPKAAFEIASFAVGQIPAGIAKEQIRAVAFLFMAGQDAKFQEFLQFLDSVALNVSRKPLYIHKALFVRINPDGADFHGIGEKVKAAGALGVIAILPGLPWAKMREIQEIFKTDEMFFRSIGEDLLKRSSIVDIIVELMLLGPG